MTAVKTKDPLTPISIARNNGLEIPTAILKRIMAGIAAAILACPDIAGGKLETNSVIFGTKNGLSKLAESTAIIASLPNMALPVPRTLGLKTDPNFVPMINYTFKLDIRTDLEKSLIHRRNFFDIGALRPCHFALDKRLVIF